MSAALAGKILLILCFGTVTAILMIAPYGIAPGTVHYHQGTVGVVEFQEEWDRMDLPWKAAYYFGDLWCHQSSERSLVWNRNQFPICARCFAIVLGVLAGLVGSIYWVATRFHPLYRYIVLITICGIIPISIDGWIQLIGLWQSTMILRIGTGVLAGQTTGLIMGIAVDVFAGALFPPLTEYRESISPENTIQQN